MAEDTNEHLGSSDCSSDGFPVCDDFLIQENNVLQEKYMDRRRGRDTLTNEDAAYGWRKSFRYVAKRQNGVQEQVRILPGPLRGTLGFTEPNKKGKP